MSFSEYWCNVTSRPSTANERHRVLRTSLATILLALSGSLLLAVQPAFAQGNANFVGRWQISGGYLGITIKSENRATGACTGITASSLYHLIGCHVTGNRYVFTITEGSSYRSRNVGTITGNRIVGNFKDTNGTNVQYTGVR